MMQEMHNHMIYFEHRLVTNHELIPLAPLSIMAQQETPQIRNLSVHLWFNFCDEVHDLVTFKPFLIAKEHGKGKKTMLTIMAILTRSQA